MKFIYCLIIAGFVATSSFAQDEKSLVAAAVRNYVDAFYEGDTTKIYASISPTVTKYGYYIPKGKSEYEGEAMSFKEMIGYATRVMKRGANPKTAQYPKTIEVYDVQNQTATAKLTAKWGTDYLLLAKFQGQWKITHVLWQSPPSK
jgi:hypothetical protein